MAIADELESKPARSLQAMQSDLEQLQARREELRVEVAKLDMDEARMFADGADLGELAECRTELLDILNSSTGALDAEEQECLAGLAEALLEEPHARRQLPLPLLLDRLGGALLPPEGAQTQPSFRLQPLELIALLTHTTVALALCSQLLTSIQASCLSAEDAVVAIVQRPDLFKLFLDSGRMQLGKGCFEEEHLVAMAESDPEIALKILFNSDCAAMLSQESIRRLSAPSLSSAKA